MRLSPPWQAGLLLAALSVPGMVVPGALPSLEWQRAALDAGQWERLFSGHFAHLDARHLLINLLGLALIVDLLLEGWSFAAIIALATASALGTGLLLWHAEPQLQWYVGLSGLLHGLWGGAALAGWLSRHRSFCLAALVALAVKLAFLNSGSGALPVVPVAHLYGAASGLLWAALGCAWSRLGRFE